MASQPSWHTVYDFWFREDLSHADAADHWRSLEWWMRGGANAELPRFAPLLEAARAGELDAWLEVPRGRLALVIVLDQFPRGLLDGRPEAYASDAHALRIVEDGLRNGHFEALGDVWEKFFFFLPLAHAEGPDHRERMQRIVAMSEEVAAQAAPHLRPIWQFSLSQARANLDVIARFGRFPHRNAVLGRRSTPAERAYLAKGDFVHKRPLPAAAETAA